MHWWDVTGLIIAGTSLVVSLTAFGLAILALRRSDRNASAGNLVALHEGLRQAWVRFLAAQEDSRRYEFAELCNLLEIGCAILADKAIHGVSRKLTDELLESMLMLIDGNQEASVMLEDLRERPSTFEYLKSFLRQKRPRIVLRPDAPR